MNRRSVAFAALALVLLASFSGVTRAAAYSSSSERGDLFLPSGIARGGVVVLPDCAPAGGVEAWVDRLLSWDYAVLVYRGAGAANRCDRASLDQSVLSGFRAAAIHLTARLRLEGPHLVALGWNTRLLIHSATAVFGGRDIFRGIVLAGRDVPAVGAALPILRDASNAEIVRQFIASQLDTPRSPKSMLPRGSVWVFDPHSPGLDVPAVGRSLFDALFGDRNGYRVPFPIERLVARLNGFLGAESSDRRVRHTLIPLGRSLQRNAALDDPFTHPRVVLAVDQFADYSDGTWRPSMRDRLFIAYQEREALLEVISFNEDAGRFEFQVVRDYAGGMQPTVRYAPRRLCVSCHQNGGPIFPEAPWDETADNPRVAAQIRRSGSRRYGISVPVADNQAFFIDTSTDRAATLLVDALLWRDGCGSLPRERERCRAAAFLRMLQYRLSRTLDFDRAGVEYLEWFRPIAETSWERNWDGVLHIPTADIPNRDLDRDGPGLPPELDPLRARPAHTTWKVENGDVDRTVTSLAAQLPVPLLKMLDAILVEKSMAANRDLRPWRATCRVVRAFGRGRWRLREVDCASDELVLRGQFRTDTDGTPAGGAVSVLRLAGGAQIGELIAEGRGHHDYLLRYWGSPLWLRPLPGLLASHLVLESTGNRTGATFWTLNEAEPLATAVKSLLDDETSENVFADEVFRPQRLMSRLLARLGAPVPEESDAAALIYPTPVLEDVQLAAPEPDTLPFVRKCAPCHSGPRKFPPPFLVGDAAAVKRQLAACAQRIAYRLRMWQLEPAARTRTPMPPESAVEAIVDPAQIDRLVSLLGAFLPDRPIPMEQEYDRLSPCL